jgi:glucose-1-phosphate adenylyltransferase
MDHIGTGKDWDLARRSGGIRILPPFITTYNSANGGKLYTTRLEALMGVTGFISRCTEEYIVLSDCDAICNIDLNEILEDHIKKSADVTIVTRTVNFKKEIPSDGATEIKCDENGFATEVSAYIDYDRSAEISTNIIVANRLFLLNAINEASAHGYSHFYKDIIARKVKTSRINCYHYDGIYLQISSLESYFRCSMQLLDPEVRNGLFQRESPIYTKLRNSAPTVYTNDSKVTNSYVADGCVIEGTVENSIIFRGVHVGKGTVVKNSILLQDTFTGSNVSLNCVITDKNVVIRNNRVLSGHESMPFFISKGAMV